MKAEYDFSKAKRGQFYKPEVVFSSPVYLEPDVDEYLNKLASEKDIDIQQLVNQWLRANIKLVESVH
ncbi:MAG TPA: hypothetical protein PLD25_05810 [Chloroflexota bacterium]|nr:hypothetical protein [Chloroflexota bacterium]HUM70831.1 hypothetical protein [Chloroflexota bacterium]